MDQLQALILGKRGDELTALQLRNLLKEETTPQLILYVAISLNRSVLNPDLLLVQAISTAKKEYDLIIVGLALRAGANPNVYVNQPNVGKMHILAYVYNELQGKVEDFIINSIVIMLVGSGSSAVRQIFDETGGMVQTTTLFTKSGGNEKQTVLEYLENLNYGTILPRLDENLTAVEPSFLTRLGTYLDRMDYVRSPPDILLVIRSHSHNICKAILESPSTTLSLFQPSIKSNSKEEEGMDIEAKITEITHDDYPSWRDVTIEGVDTVSVIIESVNTYVWELLINKGLRLGYAQVNDLVVSAGGANEKGDLISLVQYFEMIQFGVTRGLKMDLYQWQVLKNIDAAKADLIKSKYEEPYWHKTCTTEGSPDLELKQMAYSLNLDVTASKSSICSSLKELAKMDPLKVKELALIRQKNRISANTAGLRDYTSFSLNSSFNTIGTNASSNMNENGNNGGTGGNGICRNFAVMKYNPYDMHDLDLAYYKDESGVVWCFTSDQFVELEHFKKNPHTGQPLPNDFLESLRNQRRLLVRLGIIASPLYNSSEPSTFSSSVDKINTKDTITNDSTDAAVKDMAQTLALTGITEAQLKSLTPAQMELILKNINSPASLSKLTAAHRYATFLLLSYQASRQDSTVVVALFDNIRVLLFP